VTHESDRRLWTELVAAESDLYAARRRFVAEAVDEESVLREALGQPSRGTALRLLVSRPEDLRAALLPELVELAAAGPADVALCRDAIASLPESVLRERGLERLVLDVLAGASDWEFRRLAELLDRVDRTLLAQLVELAAASEDPDIREVADDFGDLAD
jgi:hypothetical protein